MWTAYSRFIVRHYCIFLIIVSICSVVFSLIPLICHDLPTFADPVIGFETRGTTLAHRFIAWENLLDETRPSKRLAVDPKEIEDQIRMNKTYFIKTRQHKVKTGHKHKNKKNHKNKKTTNNNNSGVEKVWYHDLSQAVSNNSNNSHVHWGYGRNVSHANEDVELIKNHTRNQWVTLKEMERKLDKPLHHNYASGICGPPMINYAHLVITNTANSSLLTFENVVNMCSFQSQIIETSNLEYDKICERSTRSEELCCPVWSVPNYIALISGKDSCDNLTKNDVKNAIAILEKCATFFHNFTLMASCDLNRCKVPKYCSQYNAVYNLLFYLIDAKSFSPPTFTENNVRSVMVFLPIARSSIVLPFYDKLQSSNLSYDTLTIPAMDFGLKNTLFDKWIIQDTWLMGLGSIFVFLCVLVYTKSLLLTLLLFTAILYSLGIAYFVYIYVFRLEFFPFMNLLVIVVVMGIGADDAFLYVKVWKMVGNQLMKDNAITQESAIGDIKNVFSAGETILAQIVEETLKHSSVSILVTALTTSVAFFASYVSYIPAINCFSVFAGTAVLVNFFLMISMLPVSVFVVDVKLCVLKIEKFDVIFKAINELGDDIKVISNRFIVICVTKLHIIFVVALGGIGVWSIVVVFYTPGLQLPDTRQFQLFQTSHAFEKYDMEYREKFMFEKFGNDIGIGSNMPVRWVWGVKATDNGDHMNPRSKGKLIFDDKFSISNPESQLWLSGFCMRLKAQPFYQPTLGPLLPNCFIEAFKMFMDRKCIDNIDKIDRTPCCESSKFPYKEHIFDYCIIKAMESLYQTPRELFIPGVAGPKFLRKSNPPKVAAIVIEFESVVPYSMSYKSMENFFMHVENWTQEELKNAPSTMKGGWFISDLQFFDLQRTLASGTVIALTLSAGLGFVVLIPSTFSFIISACALSAMIFSSTVTIAILILSGWKLNILESVAISTSAGLAVDFSLHYALSYKHSGGSKASRVKYALTASAGPTFTAALTTGFAGIFLLRSNLLPYSQIGVFLALITTISWIYATFFLCSLLYIFGCNTIKESQIEERKSTSRVSSICSGVPNLESHELEHLADSSHTNITHSHSPSNASATTVVLHEENLHIAIDKSIISVINKESNND